MVDTQSVKYKFFRFDFSRNNGDTAFMVIHELMLYGSEYEWAL